MSLIAVTDQMGEVITLAAPARRIVSLVPSQTELLHYLDLNEEVIGITRYCIHPAEWHARKIHVGGTKQLQLETIAGLNPDLVIGNKEENDKSQIERLKENLPVWMSDIVTLTDAFEMIRSVGELCGRLEKAEVLVRSIQAAFSDLEPARTPKRVAYFIWRKPYMAVGHDTFTGHLLDLCGFENVFSGLESRYPEVSPEMIRDAAPDILMLSSEPFPFSAKHLSEFTSLLPEARTMLVDGELFSWYGNRLLGTPAYLNEVIHESTV